MDSNATNTLLLSSIVNAQEETKAAVKEVVDLLNDLSNRVKEIEGRETDLQTSAIVEQAKTISILQAQVSSLKERLVASSRGSKKRGIDDVVEVSDSRGNDDRPYGRKKYKGSSEVKKVTLSAVVVEMARAGLVVDSKSLKDSKIPPSMAESSTVKPRVRNCLELVDYVMTPAEKEILKNGRNEDPQKLLETAEELESRAMTQMAVFEGAEPDTVSTRLKPFILGLGTRVRNYKKMIHESGNYKVRFPELTYTSLKLKPRAEVIEDAKREGFPELVTAPKRWGGDGAMTGDEATPRKSKDETTDEILDRIEAES